MPNLLMTVTVESISIYYGLILNQPEHSGLLVAGLCEWCYGADFHEPKTELVEAFDALCIFIETRCNSNGIF